MPLPATTYVSYTAHSSMTQVGRQFFSIIVLLKGGTKAQKAPLQYNPLLKTGEFGKTLVVVRNKVYFIRHTISDSPTRVATT